MNKNFLNFFGINESSFLILFNLFGLNKRIKKFVLDNELKGIIDVFLNLTLSKKDSILSHLFFIKSKKIKNYSYKGYKLIRGLPIYNQRTRTNAKTYKIKKKKQKTFKSL